MYTREELPQYVKTAGKVTVLTAIAGFLVFMTAFIFDFGAQELSKVSAQGAASTTLTVLNTPPSFDVFPYEVVESSTTTPTNSGNSVQWAAIGSDSNLAPYFLLICSTNASPTANAAANPSSLGTEPPECDGGAIQWGVSTSTISGQQATVSTTTIDSNDGPSDFAEVNEWYAWVCDDDPESPRCINVPSQGLYSTSSSPFHVNSRPVLTAASNDGPTDPDSTVTFTSTATDPDSVEADDDLRLIVCSDNTTYDNNTNTCGAAEIASSSVTAITNPSAARLLSSPIQDQSYTAWVYLVDEHDHEATGPIQADFVVNNVAPTLLNSNIDLNGGSDLVLSVPAGETTGFNLEFTISDANSCENAGGGDEITGYGVSVFRTSVGTTSCDSTVGPYDPNSCYNSGSGSATWNLSCTETLACSGATSTDVGYTCSFPLWFVADPTEGAESPFVGDSWSAAVRGIDEAATGTMVTGVSSVGLGQFLAIDIEDAEITYGSVEPGQTSGGGMLTATSVALNVGNTGIDQRVEGESMCEEFTVGNDCVHTGTTTIPASQQRFASTTGTAYTDLEAQILSSTTPVELELNVPKTTGTTTLDYQKATTYWGIEVPGTITFAGIYRGLNSFVGAVSEIGEW